MKRTAVDERDVLTRVGNEDIELVRRSRRATRCRSQMSANRHLLNLEAQHLPVLQYHPARKRLQHHLSDISARAKIRAIIVVPRPTVRSLTIGEEDRDKACASGLPPESRHSDRGMPNERHARNWPISTNRMPRIVGSYQVVFLTLWPVMPFSSGNAMKFNVL